MPETDSIWLEFQMKIKFIEVSKVSAKKQNSVHNFVETKPVNRVELLWKQKITKEDFFKEIFNKTDWRSRHRYRNGYTGRKYRHQCRIKYNNRHNRRPNVNR